MLSEQASLDAGSTVVPVIVSTDKTQLSVFSGQKEAYPAYLSIGNIPKSIRRKPSLHAQTLFAYLPTAQFNTADLTNTDIRMAKARAFHYAMKHIFSSLKEAGKEGVLMTSGDGKTRHCFPILAVYIADYPEQCLVTCVRYGHCPLCECPPDQLGEWGDCEKRSQSDVLETLTAAFNARSVKDRDTILKDSGLAPIKDPFWADLPHLSIHSSITPDILHQLYQGLIKHLTGWIQRLIGPKELDRRLSCLPPNHPVRIYDKGISSFSRLSGNEHRQIAKQLLGCLIGRVADEAVRATRALLDFLYLAQYQSHSDGTLQYLEAALSEFHAHKEIFLTSNARKGSSSRLSAVP